MNSLRDLVARWGDKATDLRRYAPEVANAIEDCASELSVALGAESDTPLTFAEAAAESGYSAEHLRKLVASGKIENAGRPNAPRIRRADLPIKPGSRSKPAVAGFDPQAFARSLTGGGVR